MDTEKLLNELTAKLRNNRGVAEEILYYLGGTDFSETIKSESEELAELDSDGQLPDYFFDLASDWEERNPDRIRPILEMLKGINSRLIDYEALSDLADLMVICYNNR